MMEERQDTPPTPPESANDGQDNAPETENLQNGGILQLLDREPPVGYQGEWTERISLEVVREETGAQSVVIFRIGSEWLALPTSVIQEVADPHTLHSIPHRSGGVLLGLVCIRGELLLCASLGALLSVEKIGRGRGANDERLLVVNQKTNRLAFPVNEVYGVHRYHPRELTDVPDTLSGIAVTYTTGLLPWQNKMVGCLDSDLLFYTLDKSFS